MATCVFCHQRKGKRPCPALGGTICSVCCGQHRLKEIRCPAECVWLGGLRAVRDQDQVQELATMDSYHAAMRKLMGYGTGPGRAACAAAYATLGLDSSPEEWELAVSMAHVYYGCRDAQGRLLLDRFLEDRGRDLSPAEAAALLNLRRAWASLFEIERVHAGDALELRDLFSDERMRVKANVVNHSLTGEVLFGWVMPMSGHFEFTGAAVRVPAPQVGQVHKALLEHRAQARQRGPGLDELHLRSESTGVVLRLLRREMGKEKETPFRVLDPGERPGQAPGPGA